jgi:Transposase DDE domain group 1
VPIECNPELFEFAPVEGRQVMAAFDGGAITSDAGGLLLGETDRAIRLTARFAACFTDARTPELMEHAVGTLVLQRVAGIALGYEDLNDHDDLRHDPVLAVLARSDCAPLAGKSTLNRLELSRPGQACGEARCPGAHQCAAYQARHGVGLPLAGRVRTRPCSIAERCRLTRTSHRTVNTSTDVAAAGAGDHARLGLAATRRSSTRVMPTTLRRLHPRSPLPRCEICGLAARCERCCEFRSAPAAVNFQSRYSIFFAGSLFGAVNSRSSSGRLRR